MDRQIVYPGQILPETALLQMTKDAMISLSKLAAATLGTGTIANGFSVTPTGPASLQVVVAPGEIYSTASIDALAFSTLPADTTHSILKQGIMLDGVTVSCPAPTTSGQSINYLVQVTYQDQDASPVLLPYYNSANPAMPYSGMGNNGLTQNTVRKGIAVVQVKAGASAITGSQSTPAPDVGYVGLYVVTVAFGQSVISSASISQYQAAPLLPSGVIQSVQTGNTTYAVDTGAANVYRAQYFPAITSISDGLLLRFKASNQNTGVTTFSPNGLTAGEILGANFSSLQGGEIASNSNVLVQWNSSLGAWVLIAGAGGQLQIKDATQSHHAVAFGQRPTEAAAGVALIATQTETNTGTDDSKIVTAKKLAAWFSASVAQATETIAGLAKIATQTTTNNGVDDTTIVTPKKLLAWVSSGSTVSTESLFGFIKIATQTLTNNGVDDTSAVTPKKLLAWVASGVAQATTSLYGFLKIATTTQATTGTDDATAMTPLKTAQALAAANTSQSLQNVIGSRTLGGSYNNNTGKNITAMVSIQGGTGAETCVVTVGGITVYTGDPGYGTTAMLTFVIPHNASYSVDVNPKSGSNLQTWVELR